MLTESDRDRFREDDVTAQIIDELTAEANLLRAVNAQLVEACRTAAGALDLYPHWRQEMPAALANELRAAIAAAENTKAESR
jgi:hypothetical protein